MYKSHTLDKGCESPSLLSGGAVQPIRLVFWGGSNDPVTSDIRVNSHQTLMSRQPSQWVRYIGDPSVTRASQD